MLSGRHPGDAVRTLPAGMATELAKSGRGMQRVHLFDVQRGDGTTYFWSNFEGQFLSRLTGALQLYKPWVKKPPTIKMTRSLQADGGDIVLSNGLVSYFPIIAGVVVAVGWGLRKYYQTTGGRRVVDALLLKAPILGNIMRKIAVARFCRTLATLISSGVPILDGLEITAKTSGNAIVEDAVMSTRKSIERGETISAPLKETAVFPAMVTQMISVGEATGALDTMLAKIADFYEEEVDTAVAGLLTLLEPIMIAMLGLIVGGIVIAMYLPIFDLISKLT